MIENPKHNLRVSSFSQKEVPVKLEPIKELSKDRLFKKFLKLIQ